MTEYLNYYEEVISSIHQEIDLLIQEIYNNILANDYDYDDVKWILYSLDEIKDLCIFVEEFHEKNTISC